MLCDVARMQHVPGLIVLRRIRRGGCEGTTNTTAYYRVPDSAHPACSPAGMRCCHAAHTAPSDPARRRRHHAAYTMQQNHVAYNQPAPCAGRPPHATQAQGAAGAIHRASVRCGVSSQGSTASEWVVRYPSKKAKCAQTVPPISVARACACR